MSLIRFLESFGFCRVKNLPDTILLVFCWAYLFDQNGVYDSFLPWSASYFCSPKRGLYYGAFCKDVTPNVVLVCIVFKYVINGDCNSFSIFGVGYVCDIALKKPNFPVASACVNILSLNFIDTGFCGFTTEFESALPTS